jgi:hypothetical protein
MSHEQLSFVSFVVNFSLKVQLLPYQIAVPFG